jgi:hypothetical protein
VKQFIIEFAKEIPALVLAGVGMWAFFHYFSEEFVAVVRWLEANVPI